MHLKQDAGSGKDRRKLYRIFVYDCPPIDKKLHYPISGRAVDFGQKERARFRMEFHKALRSQRLAALRLGDLEGTGRWQIHSRRLKEVLSHKRKFEGLTDDDFYFELRQKGVDMKIGIDIASLAYKQLIDQVILIAGDADFVPAARIT
jgi:uncharacterized LabA/DUF88 family protein